MSSSQTAVVNGQQAAGVEGVEGVFVDAPEEENRGEYIKNEERKFNFRFKSI